MNIVAAKKAKKPKNSPAAKAAKTARAPNARTPKKASKPASPAPVAASVAAPVAAPVRDNKSIYRAFVEEILNCGRFEVSSQYLDEVVTSHNPFPDQKPGREGFESALRAFREAFPDLHVNASHLVAEGDLVVGRFEVTGTQRGPFMGVAATGNAIHYEEMAIVRFAGGRIVEHWSVADGLAILQQLQASERH
jgi:predicted ester cyclase